MAVGRQRVLVVRSREDTDLVRVKHAGFLGHYFSIPW